MSTSRVFWTLVRNDSRLGSTFRFDKARGNVSALAAYLLAFGIVFALGGLLLGFGMHISDLFAERVIAILDFLITPNAFTITFLFYIPFAFTSEMLPREWKNGTVGWWLTLPYSRKLLLGAKSMAGFFRFIKFLLILFISSEYLIILIIYLQPDVENFALLHDLPQRVLYSCTIALLLSPFFVSMGTTGGVLSKAQMKGLPVIFPALFLAVIVGIFSSPLRAVFSSVAYLSPPWLSLLLVFGVSMGLSTLLFFFAINVLEHKVEL